MRNKLKKPLKKRQNSEYWIYGHHAVVAALKNEKREKYEIVFTTAVSYTHLTLPTTPYV